MLRHLRATLIGLVCLALTTGFLIGATPCAEGQTTTYEWRGTVNSDFMNPANWASSTVPPFNNAASPANARLSVYNGLNHELIYTADQGYSIYASTARSLFIGSGTAGAMTIAGGTFESQTVAGDGMANNATCRLTIDGGSYLNLNNPDGLERTDTGKSFLVVYDGTNANGTLTINNGEFAVKILKYGYTSTATGAGTVNLNGGTLSVARIVDAGANVVSQLNFNGGLLKALGSEGNLLQNLDAVYVQAGGAMIDTDVYSVGIAQNLLDAGGGLTKLGSGTLTLSGTNTYRGATQVNAGALRIAKAEALGATTAGTTVLNGARLELANGITVAGESISISGTGDNYGSLQSQSGDNTWAGTVTLGTGDTRVGAEGADSVLRISGNITNGTGTEIHVRNGSGKTVFSGTPKSYTGKTQVMSGTLQIEGANILPTSTSLVLGTSLNATLAGVFDLNGFDQQLAGLGTDGDAWRQAVTNSSATDAALTVHNTDASTYAGSLAGNLALAKSGSGQLTLAGTNTSTGDVRIVDGTLVLMHASSNNLDRAPIVRLESPTAILDVTGLLASRLVLADGQGLEGTGTVRGNVTVGAASALAPGLLTIEGAYDQAGLLQIELSGYTQGIDYDWLTVTGAATLHGQLELSLLEGFAPSDGDTFQVLTAASITDLGLELVGELDAGWDYRIVPWASGQALELYVATAVVPEPSTLGLALILLAPAGLLWFRRAGH